MTAMNAMIGSDSIILSMDTLVSTYDEDGNIIPNYFTKKFEYMPFAKSVICGTGSSDVIEAAINISRRMLACEVDALAKMLSECLFGLDEDEYHISDAHTSTIYIYGFTEDGTVNAYALRSTKKFECELIADSDNPKTLIKPNFGEEFLDKANKALEQDDYFMAFRDVMRIEKEYDNQAGKHKVGIGGENTCLIIAKDSNDAIIKKIDTFDDYSDQYQFALDKTHENL